jgi:hypothetical protein
LVSRIELMTFMSSPPAKRVFGTLPGMKLRLYYDWNEQNWDRTLFRQRKTYNQRSAI